jgi:hypothetical protein
MSLPVTAGATLICAAGTAPSALVVVAPPVLAEKKPEANILDFVPFVNIMPFGTCNILTAAASGVPTPCVPATAAPWAPGSPTVLVRGAPALNNASVCACSVGGVISISYPATTTETVP